MLVFYNTIKRKKEEFVPIEKDRISLYTCGPTVYNYAHIGNFRAYIFEDLLRRYLEFRGFKVYHIMNITDIDDKTIKKSIEEKISLIDFTNKYTQAFFEDVETLNIVKAHKYPRATNFIKQMIDMISVLEEKGYTYTTDDGSVFFRISEYNEYGRLANLNPEDLKVGERVEEDEYEKEEGRDFALWKAYKNEDGEVYWDSPWGKGRPGWHIECSAMSTDYLGPHFDIHCGGVDNIFPHHENEIAQSVCALDSKFVNYWLHNEHLLVDSDKMSKSKGNFYTLRDLVNKGYSPQAIRYSLMSTHYRQKLNFTFDKINNSQKSINKLLELKRRLRIVDKTYEDQLGFSEKTEQFVQNFKKSMDDDLNISGALGELFKWVNYIFGCLDNNKISISQSDASINVLNDIDKVLGVLSEAKKEEISEKISKMIAQRELARKEKNWELADKIRSSLDDMDIIIEDTDDGPIWKKKPKK